MASCDFVLRHGRGLSARRLRTDYEATGAAWFRKFQDGRDVPARSEEDVRSGETLRVFIQSAYETGKAQRPESDGRVPGN